MSTNYDYWVYEPNNPSTIPVKIFKSKTYSCPDCPFKDDNTVGCLDCTRGRMPFNIQVEETKSPYFPSSPYTKTYFKSISEPCLHCPNHPINGGKGNCNCTLGIIQFT